MKVLLMTPFVTGHFNGMIGVAERLLSRGVEVGWTCMGLADPTAAHAAIAAIGARPIRMEWPFPRLLAGQSEEGRSVELRTRRFKRVTVDNEVVAPCLAIIREFGADVVGVDPAFYSGIIAAQLAGRPHVNVHTNLSIVAPAAAACERVEIDRGLAGPRRELFERFGVPVPEFRRCESISPHANSLWITESFLRGAGAELPAGTRCVGPSIPRGRRHDQVEFDWDRLDDRPLVFASPGTVYPPPRSFFLALATACERLDLQLVVVGQGLLDEVDLASRPIVVNYAPQLQMLERAAVFVTHGGANSIMEAIYFGRPMLVTPLASDQPVQAHFVKANGNGLAIDPYSADAGAVEAALARLVEPDRAIAARAAELEADYRRHDGADTVAQWMIEIAERAPRPASPSAAR